MTKKKILLDTDPGIDDMLAIMLAWASPECELLGVTTVSGNCHVRDGTRHAVAVKKLLQAELLPVCQGCHRPMTRTLRTQKDLYGQEESILIGDLPDWESMVDRRHAVNFILQQARQHAGELTLFPLGPLTNIATALIMDADFSQQVKEIILMGGAARVPGNSYPTVEFNFLVDPEAASVVFQSGIPITMVGLDVTGKAALLPEDALPLAAMDTPASRFVLSLVKHYFNAGRPCVLYDPLAVAIGLFPELLLEAPEVFVAIDTKGDYTAGTSACDFRGLTSRQKNARVATRVDEAGFLSIFWERVIGAPSPA